MNTPVTEAMEKNKRITIPEFYAGKIIFITGATGFMGKVLVEKLLRSCPDISKIYLLVRDKKSCSGEHRLQKILQEPLFDILREKSPAQFKKLIVVGGDVAEKGLGLSEKDRQTLVDEVSIVFHVAATVRFDDSLKNAVLTNTRGTLEVVNLCRAMSNLDVLVHVSTTYSNPFKSVVDERIYPAPADWRQMIKICENADERVLSVLESKLVSNYPNTYTFSKALAEHVINTYRKEIPSVIIRPSIVCAAAQEPIPGWVDNMFGPMGLMLGGGKGLVRVSLANPDTKADYIPVDYAIKALIASPWDQLVNSTSTTEENISVYHSATNSASHYTQKQIIDCALALCEELPMEDMIWLPSTSSIPNYTLFFINTILFQFLPALLLDFLLKMKNKKPLLARIQRKIFLANLALEYFTTKIWEFKNDRYVAMEDHLLESDRQAFQYNSRTGITDLENHIRNSMYVAKTFLLKEDPARYPICRKHYQRLLWADRTVKCVFTGLMVYILLKIQFLHHAGSFLSKIVL